MSQALFSKALLNPDLPAPAGLGDGFGGDAGSRFTVYRNNVTVSLTEALETGFPAIAKLLGTENFRNIAREYLRAQPPTSPVMMLYGASFADFLEAFPPLEKFGYLPDVARLEYALRESYHAEDSDPIKPDALGQVAPEDLAGVRFSLAKSMRVISSPWPVFSLWRFNTQDGVEAPTARAETVLITRPEYDPEPDLLEAGADHFIAALQNGQTLGEAASEATEIHQEFDLSTALSTLLTRQAITHISLEERP